MRGLRIPRQFIWHCGAEAAAVQPRNGWRLHVCVAAAAALSPHSCCSCKRAVEKLKRSRWKALAKFAWPVYLICPSERFGQMLTAFNVGDNDDAHSMCFSVRSFWVLWGILPVRLRSLSLGTTPYYKQWAVNVGFV